MGRFEGTTQEFKRYIGAHLRNVVNQITRQHKAAIRACEHCGVAGALDAAHVRGRDRTQIIDHLLGERESDALVSVDLKEFERKFKHEHSPVEKAILVLCKDCHRSYDADHRSRVHPAASKEIAPPQTETIRREILPISLVPPRPDDFKARLLERKAAVIEVLYADGSVVRRPWNASRFADSSCVLANLRSRPEFRQGAWQSSAIVKVNVRVVE